MLAFALAGCGGGGYRDAPTIAFPSGPGMASEVPPPAYVRDPAPPPASLLPPTAQDVPADAPQGAGPRGTSGEAREDVVGYAALMAGPGDARFGPGLDAVAVGVAHPSLPPGGFVELTSLDTGRTIVAMIVAPSDGGSVVALSPGAAQALGVGDRAAVRVRTVAVSPQDQVALRSGQAASPRLDAPAALLAALRRKLPAQSTRDRRPAAARSAPLRTPAPGAAAAPTPARGGSGFFVQVAALSSAERAAALARDIGGHVAASGSLYRVHLGPYADAASAQRARDGVARRGYGDARIFHTE